ncbi:Uncharacterised protein [Mycobacteroides abscessus subsp. abscessus]|nr:Uncharacterised protein [Mycobacteroides abscessus subsp. abscessus]
MQWHLHEDVEHSAKVGLPDRQGVGGQDRNHKQQAGFHSSRDQADGGSAGMLVNPREKSSFIDCIMRIFE